MHKLRFFGMAMALIAASAFALSQVGSASAYIDNNTCTSPQNNCTPIVCSSLLGNATTNGDNLGPTTAFACGLGGTRATSSSFGGAVVSSQSTGYANHAIASGNQAGCEEETSAGIAPNTPTPVTNLGVVAAAGSAPNGSNAVAALTTGPCDTASAIAYHNGFNGEASSAAAAAGGGAIANTSAYTGIVAGNFACTGQASVIVYAGQHLALCAGGVPVP